MALVPNPKWLIVIIVAAVLWTCSLLLWTCSWQKTSWNRTLYFRDPRAPKVCMCLWMHSAFRVPCEDIPPEAFNQ